MSETATGEAKAGIPGLRAASRSVVRFPAALHESLHREWAGRANFMDNGILCPPFGPPASGTPTMTLNLRAFIVALVASVSLVSVAAAAAPKHDCQAAKDLFNNRCVMCHGPDGKGYAAIGTPNFTDSKFQASQTDAQLIEAVTDGKRGTTGQMPSFKGQLTSAQISDLVHCVVRGFAPGGAKSHSAKHTAHHPAHK